MPRPIEEGEMHTYADWQRMGYQVQRGQHHTLRDMQGQPLFAATQVRPRNTAPPNPNAFQQRPRRVRRERQEAAPPVEVRYDSYGSFEGTWGTAHAALNRSGAVMTNRLSGGNYYTYSYQSPWVNNWPPEPVAPPLPSPEEVAMHEAEMRAMQASYAVVAAQRKANRKYLPEDDASSEGFRKLCAVEKALKEK